MKKRKFVKTASGKSYRKYDKGGPLVAKDNPPKTKLDWEYGVVYADGKLRSPMSDSDKNTIRSKALAKKPKAGTDANWFLELNDIERDVLLETGDIKKKDIRNIAPVAGLFINSKSVEAPLDAAKRMADLYEKRPSPGTPSAEEVEFKRQFTQQAIYGYPKNTDAINSYMKVAKGEAPNIFDKVRTPYTPSEEHRLAFTKKYLGVPVENEAKFLRKSASVPSVSKDANAEYYDMPEDAKLALYQKFNDAYKDIHTFEKKAKALAGRNASDEDVAKARARLLTKLNPDFFGNLGNFKVGYGKDPDSGEEYLSYYDAWNLDPAKLKGVVDIDKYNFPFEIYGRMTSRHISGDIRPREKAAKTFATGGQIGSTVGSVVGAASNLLVPGLGSLLSPLLSSLGSVIGGQSDARSDAEKQVGQMTVNKNPYGLKEGGPIPGKKQGNMAGDKEKAWIANWLSSAESQKRAANFGITADDLKKASDRMTSTPVNFYPQDVRNIAAGGEYDRTKYPPGAYNPKTGEVQMYVTPSSIANVSGRTAADFTSTVLHELAHSTGIDQRMQPSAPKSKTMQSYFDEGEAWPRIMEIRYNLNLQPGQKVEQSHIDAAKKSMPNNLIFKAYDDADIIQMMNTMVSAPTKDSNIKMAKYGGFLTGMEDASVYKGRLHSKGGILVNSKGVPSGKPAAEVEGGETVVKINGKSYVFSDRLKI